MSRLGHGLNHTEIAGQFRDAILKAGIQPPDDVVDDGALHRFPTNKRSDDDAGWYTLFSDGVPAGAFGCWRSGISQTWCAIDQKTLSDTERRAVSERLAAIRAEREAAVAQDHANARERAARIWEAARDAMPDHPYLTRKGVGAHGIRQNGDRLIVPVRDGGGMLHGLQFIAADGSKRFLKGMAKSGHFHLIGEPGDLIVIAEGYATAASVFEATGYPVAVAFDADNLGRAAETIRSMWPAVHVMIAGDNDASGIGQSKALAAARLTGGVAVIPATTGDWNDIGIAEGSDTIRTAFTNAVAEPKLEVPAGFKMRSSGLWWEDAADPDKPAICISGPFDIVAETRDADGGSWGVLLRWKDHDRRSHEWAMPRALLAGDGTDLRRVLLDGGLFVAPTKRARDLLNTYVGTAKINRRARPVTRIGWHGNAFVLPEECLGQIDGERIILQTAATVDHALRTGGMFAEWQERVAARCIGNSRLVIALSTALAAPLVELMEAESGGFHFRGASSTGKSTALLAAASVWGGNGYVRSWRVTANGLEGVAAGHNDALLCLDELGQVPARDAGEAAYLLANGAGKSRATREGLARKPARWRLLFLSSGEIGLADKVAEDGRGRRVAAGQQVRVIDVPADAGAGMGLFETIHDCESADAFAREIKAGSIQHYGHAARIFIDYLSRDRDRVKAAVAGFMDQFVADTCPPRADGQVSRVALRFALVAAAGELATKLGILPWYEGEATSGSARCLRDWLDCRGGIEPSEVREGIAQVRAFIEAHAESRFAPWGSDVTPSDASRPTINRVGFRKTTADGETEFYVFPEAWRKEVCAGFDATLLAKTLVERGLLIPDKDGKFQSRHRVGGSGTVRLYRLTAAILGGEHDH
ncbi:DUF927 domain-containing protein [Mesorhizobium sp. IMUNJ 23232]|uniref:DUF927 domain-containing protein n=1 Tax=Mesorhizobium sp. IMUNJ 23232 TaxID=3376064 RepID=UPI0037B2EFAD